MHRASALILTFSLAACGRASTVSPSEGVVALVGGHPITIDQVQAEAHSSGQAPAAALESLIRLELVAQAATQAGVTDQRELDELQKSAMVQRYLEREFEPASTLERVPDAETRRLYETARQRFVHGRLVEVALLAVLTGERMVPTARAEREATGRAMAEQVKAQGLRTEQQLQALAAEPAWHSKAVTFRRTHVALDVPFCRQLGEQVLRMAKPGDQTGLVICPDGAFIASYLGELPPEDKSFDSVRDELRAVLWERWRKQFFLQHSFNLARSYNVEEVRDRVIATPLTR